MQWPVLTLPLNRSSTRRISASNFLSVHSRLNLRSCWPAQLNRPHKVKNQETNSSMKWPLACLLATGISWPGGAFASEGSADSSTPSAPVKVWLRSSWSAPDLLLEMMYVLQLPSRCIQCLALNPLSLWCAIEKRLLWKIPTITFWRLTRLRPLRHLRRTLKISFPQFLLQNGLLNKLIREPLHVSPLRGCLPILARASRSICLYRCTLPPQPLRHFISIMPI